MVESETMVCFIPANEDIFLDPNDALSRLPQPYRMLNKLVEKIFETAWCHIDEKLQKKSRIEARPKAAILACTRMIEVVTDLHL